MTNVRVGLLGAGGVVKEYHLPVLANMPGVQVDWICDTAPERAELLKAGMAPRARVLTSIEGAPDVDIVLVALPVGFRMPLIEAMFRRGWNVFCEKPFAVSVADHERLVAGARAANVRIGVGLMRRFYASTIAAERLLQSRICGDIVDISASQGVRLNRTNRSDWYQSDPRASGGGVLIETGSHLVDQLFTMLGVTGFNILSCRQKKVGELENETVAVAELTTKEQQRIRLNLAVSQTRELFSGFNIRFANGALRLGMLPSDKVVLLDSQERQLVNVAADGAVEAHQAFYLEWREFIDQCRERRPTSRASAETALQSTAFIEACYAYSAREVVR
jgi:predicted dehydrogenase